jgi:hypothetical protein
MIQSVINRMGNNSFYIKGWCVTLVAAILGLVSKDMNKRLIIIVYFPIIMFWILDAYFLYQEKLFRTLYNTVRNIDNEHIDFSMNAHEVGGIENKLIDALISKTMFMFYGVMTVIAFIAIALLLNWI